MNEYLTLMELSERLHMKIGELLDLLAFEGLLAFTPNEVDGYAYLVTEKGEKLTLPPGDKEIRWEWPEIEKLIRKEDDPPTWATLEQLAERWSCCYWSAATRLYDLGALMFRINYDEGEPYRLVIPYGGEQILRVRDGVVEWDIEALEALK